MTSRFRILCAAALVAAPLAAQSVRPQIDAWRRAHEREILDEAFALLSLPNVASDSADIARNVEFLTAAFAKRGVALTPLRVPGGRSPALFGELRGRNATRTVVFYAHYDGQPVAGGGWDGEPFRPELRRFANSVATDAVPLPARGAQVDPEVRIRARSASDDKGPIVAMLAALDAMTATGRTASVNVKFFLEGEEEGGSRHLGEILRTHRDKLAADAWLFFDGPVHVSGRPQLVLGVRGVMGMEVTFYGANRALHSGHYGNWSPNPAVAAAHFRRRHPRPRRAGADQGFLRRCAADLAGRPRARTRTLHHRRFGAPLTRAAADGGLERGARRAHHAPRAEHPRHPRRQRGQWGLERRADECQCVHRLPPGAGSEAGAHPATR